MKSDVWLGKLGERLESQIRFLLEADRLKEVIRGSRIASGARRENVAEHSWHLALFAVTLSEWAIAPVNIWRVAQMLMIHDLVEIDSGDTPLFDAERALSQPEQEQIAAKRLFGLLPLDQGTVLLDLWTEFENAETADARFAKALDRLQPILLNHVVGGGTWTDYEVDETRERRLTCRIAEGSPALWALAETVFEDAVAHGWLKPSADHRA